MQELSKETIISAAAGDIEDFEKIYRAYSDFVYNVACGITCNNEEAAEVSQDVFINIFKEIKKFRFDSSLNTWIYRITVNRALTHMKKNSARMKRHVNIDEFSDHAKISENTIEKDMERDENGKLAQELLRKLDPENRIYLVLREIEGLSYKEIAESLNQNLNTVRTRIRRSREFLMKGLSGGEEKWIAAVSERLS